MATGSSSSSSTKPKGCYLTQTAGFILLLLAALLAVGVGLLVHFTAEKGKDSKCNCVYPGSTTDLDLQSQDPRIQFCNSLGEKMHKCKYNVRITLIFVLEYTIKCLICHNTPLILGNFVIIYTSALGPSRMFIIYV